jgi:hypothetical protein
MAFIALAVAVAIVVVIVVLLLAGLTLGSRVSSDDSGPLQSTVSDVATETSRGHTFTITGEPEPIN